MGERGSRSRFGFDLGDDVLDCHVKNFACVELPERFRKLGLLVLQHPERVANDLAFVGIKARGDAITNNAREFFRKLNGDLSHRGIIPPLAPERQSHHLQSMALSHPLHTARLRLEPVTGALTLAAGKGKAALEQALGAAVDAGWRGEHVFGRARVALDDHPRHALVIHAADRKLIGEVRFEPLRPNQGVGGDGFEIGYAIVPAYRRQGYAVEATRAVIRALEDEGASHIIAGCDMKNLASVRTLRRLGFTLDGSIARANAFWWVRRAPV